MTLSCRPLPVGPLDADDAHGRRDPMAAWPDPTEMRERHRRTDRSMAAHADVADVVEEDHARSTARIDRLAQQRADDHIGSARLIDNARAIAVVLRAEALPSLGERTGAQRRSAFDHDSRRLSSGVRINDAD